MVRSNLFTTGMLINVVITAALVPRAFQTSSRAFVISTITRLNSSRMSSSSSSQDTATSSRSGAVYGKPIGSKGNILLLGGSGFLGSAIAKRALLEGYDVTSISRRGKQQRQRSDGDDILDKVNYIQGDARDSEIIHQALSIALEKNHPYTAIIHAIGLLLDGKSGLGKYNQFASGSGSLPDEDSTYDDITRKTAFNAIDAIEPRVNRYSSSGKNNRPIPFVFISAAEAGWPDMPGGSFVENNLAPEWLRRYLAAKRTVEDRLRNTDTIRPIIFRPSLIFSFERLMSLAPVAAFFIGNKIGLPFVDRPVTVQTLAAAVVSSLEDDSVRGVQRYKEIDALGSR